MNEIHEGSQFKKIIKYGPWYFFSTVLTKLASLFLLPIYTKYLSPEDYGILNTLTSYGSTLPIFISLAVDRSFERYYFQEKKISTERIKVLYSTLFWFIAIWGTMMTGLSLIFSPYLLRPMLDINYWPYVPLTVVPLLFSQLSLLGVIFLQANLRTLQYAIINLFSFIVSTVIVVILLVHLGFGIKANLIGSFAGIILTFFIYIIFSIKNSLLGFSFDFKVIKRSLIYSLPLLPGIASSWITTLSDRMILAFYGKIKEVGLYSISVLIAQGLYFFHDAITRIQGPISYSALTDNVKKAKEQISDFLSLFLWAVTFAFLALTFFSKEALFLLTNERYHDAYKLVGVLAFSYLLGGLYRPFMVIISFHAKTWILAFASILSAIVNAILNFIFIPYFGQYAAAISTLFSVFSYTVWIIWWAQKIDKIPVQWNIIYRINSVMVLMIMAMIGIELFHISILFKFILKAGVLFCYPFINMPENINKRFIRKFATIINIEK